MSSQPAADTSPQPMNRGDKRRHTRRRVLEAALEVFEVTDYEEANTSEIARIAGVSHGTIFTVEKTKERLAAAAFNERIREVGEAAFAEAFSMREPLSHRIMSVFTALFDFYQAHENIARILLRELLLGTQADDTNPKSQILRDYLTGLRVLIQTEEDPTEARDPEALAPVILGTYLVYLLGQLNSAYPDREAQDGACLRSLKEIVR